VLTFRVRDVLTFKVKNNVFYAMIFILEFWFRIFDIEVWLPFHQVVQVYKTLRVYMLDI